ncbi:uncharacterized protein LOC128724390 [Anopheles nili]|uniref:uncharacterized protein LOC128724390 n=1 Tax=Anopheles nili TaxID=185578 RepID=UPI00237A2CF0|nr:uncharacterized protein LOC128724390 [Anopheles nili]
MTDNNTLFRGLMQKPYEPTFVPKVNGRLYYDLPDAYLTDQYRPFGATIQTRFSTNAEVRVPFPNITPPDLGFADMVKRRGAFSIFNSGHRRAAGKLIQLFLDQPDPTALGAMAAYVRDRVNAPMYQYALAVALIHREDTRDVNIPSFLELFPDRFVDPAVIPQLREEGNLLERGNRRAIDLPTNYTASDRIDEQKVAYWREDIGLSLHHWHWHLVYPSTGPDRVVRKDRRGELFYHMHQQTIARYNIERFANGLPRTRSFSQLREPIPEAYFPKIVRSSDGRAYSCRYPNQLMNDVNRVEDGSTVKLTDMDVWIKRIFDAIDGGVAQATNGDRVPLNNNKGIDLLGDILEASTLSINFDFYGDYHQNGHVMLGYIHDPDNSYLEGVGVMGDLTTTMRDPLFYRWHQHIDDIFVRHKQKLPAYTSDDLAFRDVTVDAFNVQLNKTSAPLNELLTFWQRSQFDLGTGMDFVPEGNLFVTFTHIQHAPFSYRIQATNRASGTRRGTVRLFLGPKVDGSSQKLPFSLQRRHMVELDKFTVDLRPGENSIVRRSDQSNLTIPYERTFRNIAESSQPGAEVFQFCNCGWPSHMLLPKGGPNGLQYDFFVIISDYTQDRVEDFNENDTCNDAHMFCGLRERRYPDARSMGYPFDRFTASSVNSLQDFARPYRNMAVTPVSIRYINSVINRYGTNAQTRIPLPNITAPDLAYADSIARRGGFSVFQPAHQRVASQLIELFLSQPNPDALSAMAVYTRDRINAPLFQYALAVALMHRSDTRDVEIPSFLELFPDRYIDPAVFPQLREEGTLVEQADRRAIEIPMNFTASERVDEQRLAYWREDIGVNLHHWHWHLVYPARGPDRIVRKDRRGELFYYMHQQTMARYNTERYANGLAHVVPFRNLREAIPEGYFPKITRSSDGRSYPARHPNESLSDLKRVEDGVIVSIADMELWTSRILEAIDNGFALSSNDQRVSLDNDSGIDLLGNIVEASTLSVNLQHYGDLHNNGHNILGYIHDPENSFLEGFGVVGDNTTAMRDPVFYRWHQHIDDIFVRHKQRRPAYTGQELAFNDVAVDNFEIQLNKANAPINILLTFWQRSQVNLGTGLDFAPDGNLFATFTHIQHAPFTYRIRVNNRAGATRRGTVRIFFGPKTNERGQTLPFRDQRRLMVELDKFTVMLNAGANTIVRRSEQSSVTIPYERTFRNVAASSLTGNAAFQFCNCGWPNHMLLPKGSPDGLEYDFFIMVSDYTQDRVEDFDENVNCNDAHSFCGLRDRRYPDARSMGYPFDRFTPGSVGSLQDFTKPYINMPMASVRQKFHGLLQHPYEPLFLPKNDGKLFYDLPEEFFTDRYRPIGQNLINRFSAAAAQRPNTSAAIPSAAATSRVAIRNISAPDIKFAETIPRRGGFSLFIPEHRRIAGRLIELFLSQPDADTLGDVAAYARDRLNGPLFQYAIATAMVHRSDTENVPVPSFLHLFPDQFVDPAIFPKIMEEGRAVLQPNRMAVDIPMNYTASEKIAEQRLAYFREDIGVNLHHWHWHLVYPGEGPTSVVRKSRRGELFYYMHQQLIVRYQVERYANGLGQVVPYDNLRAPIPEPYYPKIVRSANNRTYPARYSNMTLEDVNRPDDKLQVSVADTERQLSRIVEAIDAGVAVSANGQRIPLDNFRGIDVLGDIVESSVLSINRPYYGDTHNNGHILISFIHDPKGDYLESFGAMGDVTTAMRDPIFYRWHTYVDNIFQRHKLRFSPYTAADLANPGVNLLNLETELDRQGSVKNLMLTFWQRSQVDLGTGLDFGPEGNVFATFTHLQHAAFNYRLQVACSGGARPATVRFFLSPKRNERGTLLTFEEQRRLAIELDRFKVNLTPGINTIIRRSMNSSVTIPYERTFRNVSQSNAGDEMFRFCSCGWPSHMLIPKGDAKGVEYDLFAMLSDYSKDKVDPPFEEAKNCNDAHSFCGLRDRAYPDARNMGFPFDRRASPSIRSFAEFVAPYQNMRVATITVRFTNTVVMSDIETGFLCLMTRPSEPLFYPKYNGEVVMDLPREYLSERYQDIADSIKTNLGSTAKHHVSVKLVDLPDFGYAERVPRHGDFNIFNPAQRHVAGQLVGDLLAQPDLETLLSVASYARDRLNPTMFQYALGVVLLHRKDTSTIPVPSFLEMFPKRFVDPALFPKLREEGFVVEQRERVAIEMPQNFSASEAEPEQRLAYFREDIGVNLHHWHWHLVYPQEGPVEVVRKDRRGELFYYMHRQIVARYNAERFSNLLPPATPLHNLREPIPEAYFPKILNSALNRTYPGRMANMVLSHVNRPEDDAVATILELESSLGKIKEAIQSGFAILTDGTRVPLDAKTGIDTLGNIMENSVVSVNAAYYGNYHSLGHIMIGYIHDPDNLHLESHGVMGDITTAMRDPTFYRFHAHVDDVFDLHKLRLPAYTQSELSFPGVSIVDASVQITSGKAARNRLLTFWQRTQVDLGTGLDFGPHGNVLATFTHLQHAPFAYQIMVHNETHDEKKGTVRIFLAPIYNADGGQLLLAQQRRCMIELDKFVVKLHPGENRIIRRSDQSSVTIPYERTFRRVDVSNMPGSESFRFCNCGWPDHMLLPKGRPEGQPFDLFIMVSDYKADAVKAPFDEKVDCNDSHSYCGLRDQLYPDRRAMGFPFDRPMMPQDHLMRDFVDKFPNMSRTVADVVFTNTVISRT